MSEKSSPDTGSDKNKKPSWPKRFALWLSIDVPCWIPSIIAAIAKGGAYTYGSLLFFNLAIHLHTVPYELLQTAQSPIIFAFSAILALCIILVSLAYEGSALYKNIKKWLGLPVPPPVEEKSKRKLSPSIQKWKHRLLTGVAGATATAKGLALSGGMMALILALSGHLAHGAVVGIHGANWVWFAFAALLSIAGGFCVALASYTREGERLRYGNNPPKTRKTYIQDKNLCWFPPMLAAVCKSLGDFFGFFSFLSMSIYGKLALSAALLHSPLLPALLPLLVVSLITVSLGMEGVASKRFLAGELDPPSEEDLNTNSPRWAAVLGWTLATLGGICKGGGLAFGSTGLLTLLFTMKVAILSGSVAILASPGGQAAFALGLIIGVAVAAISMNKEGRSLKNFICCRYQTQPDGTQHRLHRDLLKGTRWFFTTLGKAIGRLLHIPGCQPAPGPAPGGAGAGSSGDPVDLSPRPGQGGGQPPAHVGKVEENVFDDAAVYLRGFVDGKCLDSPAGRLQGSPDYARCAR